MSQTEEKEVVNTAKGLAKFLAVEVKIKIFGVTILEYHFPPKF